MKKKYFYPAAFFLTLFFYTGVPTCTFAEASGITAPPELVQLIAEEKYSEAEAYCAGLSGKKQAEACVVLADHYAEHKGNINHQSKSKKFYGMAGKIYYDNKLYEQSLDYYSKTYMDDKVAKEFVSYFLDKGDYGRAAVAAEVVFLPPETFTAIADGLKSKNDNRAPVFYEKAIKAFIMNSKYDEAEKLLLKDHAGNDIPLIMAQKCEEQFKREKAAYYYEKTGDTEKAETLLVEHYARELITHVYNKFTFYGVKPRDYAHDSYFQKKQLGMIIEKKNRQFLIKVIDRCQAIEAEKYGIAAKQYLNGKKQHARKKALMNSQKKMDNAKKMVDFFTYIKNVIVPRLK